MNKNENIKYANLPIIIKGKRDKEEKINNKSSKIITAILINIIFLLLINIDVNIKELQMPAVYAIYKIIPYMKNIYGITILISIFTTAISLGISFLQNITKRKKSYNFMASLICLTGVIFSKIGFSNLINLFYPILGIFGIVQLILIFKIIFMHNSTEKI